MPHNGHRRALILGQFLKSRRAEIAPTKQELRDHPVRRVKGLTRKEVALRAGVSETWYSWLETGRAVHATPETLLAIARALQFNREEQTYLLALAGDAGPGLPLGQTGDINVETLGRIVNGFQDGPAFVVNRRWNIVAANVVSRQLYGYTPSSRIQSNIIWRLLKDPSLRSIHSDPDAMMEAVVSLVRYNYGDDPDSEELTQLLDALAGSERFQSAWRRCAVRVFSPKHVFIRRDGKNQRYLFVALAVGHQGRETLVLHLPT
jgi:transcriptional regulator with XRE-family HTH domain